MPERILSISARTALRNSSCSRIDSDLSKARDRTPIPATSNAPIAMTACQSIHGYAHSRCHARLKRRLRRIERPHIGQRRRRRRHIRSSPVHHPANIADEIDLAKRNASWRRRNHTGRPPISRAEVSRAEITMAEHITQLLPPQSSPADQPARAPPSKPPPRAHRVRPSVHRGPSSARPVPF